MGAYQQLQSVQGQAVVKVMLRKLLNGCSSGIPAVPLCRHLTELVLKFRL